MVKQEENVDKVEEEEKKTVTIDKEALDALIKRVEQVEKAPQTNNSNEGFPIKPVKPDFINKTNPEGKQYTPEEVQYFQNMSYYEGYPKINAGRIEFTGKLYELDDTYKPLLKGNSPVCLCGKVKDLDTLKTTGVLFVPHRGAWICQSALCEQQYHRRYGGFERLVSRHLFARDTPYYGMALPDKNDPCTRRGIYPDKRMNEYNF
jgi:hypothetical protein